MINLGLTKIKSWIRQIQNWLNLNKSGQPTSENSEKPENEKTEEQVPINELSRLYQFHVNIPGMSVELRTSIADLMAGSWKLGFDDGVLGQKQMPKDFFRIHASQLQSQLLYFLRSNTVSKIRDKDKMEAKYENAQKVFQQAEDYRNDVMTRQQLYPRSFSKWLGFIYILIGTILLLADIPLALLATQYGFNFPFPDQERHEIKNLFVLNSACIEEGEGLSKHLLQVITNNWQVFFMTVGVAVCTFYIKIFYDDFMGYPADKAVRQFTLLSHNKNIGGDFNEDETKEIKQKYNWRLLAKTVILLLTLGTIICLGFFRAYNNNSASGEHQSALVTTVYILISILFPTISGICFSLGMGNFHNRGESNIAEKVYQSKQSEALEAMDNFKKASSEKEMYDSLIETCNSDNFLQDYETCFFNCYLHGYQRGVVSPDRNLDIFERARRFRDRILATKSNEAIQRANRSVDTIDPFQN